MGKVDESIVKISRDPRCLLTFIAHQLYDVYGKSVESFAFSIHEDSLKPLVSKEAWALLDEGKELTFKLVCGTTICPKCGYMDYYKDGSL